MIISRATNEARAAALLDRPWRLLIGGELVAATNNALYATHCPADGRHLADVPFAGRADVAAAVAAAAAAAPGWRRTPLIERGRILQRAVDLLRANAHDLGLMDGIDSGNPVAAMAAEVEVACEWLEYIRGVSFELKGQVLPANGNHWLFTRREPYGVVGRIIAFNHPILFAIQKLGAPLMAGNTLVLKAPDQTPLAPLLMGELLREVFPPGVLNIVTGDGPTTGDALVRHPTVKRLALIGSIPTGQRIMRSAAESGIKHVSLELGGKNPLIVFPDADLDRAAQAAVNGMNFRRTQGQSCGSTTRLFLHDEIHDAVLERVVALAANVKIGHPLDPASEMGALVSAQQRDRVLGYIAAAKAEGARLVCGGSAPAGLEDGYFVAPTIFANVTPEMTIAREEIFGPVLSVLRWRDSDDVLAQANALPYGLTAAVWTRDLNIARQFADELDAGYVWVNGSAAHYLGAPFSGHKSSGTDSEEGIEELFSYTQVKTVSLGPG